MYDVSFAQALAAGDYYVVLSVFNNTDKGYLPTSLVVASPYSNSTFDYAYFNYSVLGDTDNFTYSQLGGFSTGDPTPFWYDSTTQRTGGWALDIIASSMAVPEPGSLGLLLLGLPLLGLKAIKLRKPSFASNAKTDIDGAPSPSLASANPRPSWGLALRESLS